MSNESKGERAGAMIAVLQTILDNLPEGSAGLLPPADRPPDALPPVSNPTHQLFMERLNQNSLAGLFASIRIIHHVNSTPPGAP